MLAGQTTDDIQQTGVETHFDNQVQQRQGQHHHNQHTLLMPGQRVLVFA